MFGIGAPEILLILVVALIFLGPAKLPEMARTLGKTYRQFQHAMDDIKRDFNDTKDSITDEFESSVSGVKKDIADAKVAITHGIESSVTIETALPNSVPVPKASASTDDKPETPAQV